MKFVLSEGVMQEVNRAAPANSPSVYADVRTLLDQIKAGTRLVVEHIDRYKVLYRVGALTVVVLLGGIDLASAATESGIDAGAERLYVKLVNIGKWVIIIKTGFDAINAAVQGDFIAARKSALVAVFVFLILLGLPWAFDQVETLFEDVT